MIFLSFEKNKSKDRFLLQFSQKKLLKMRISKIVELLIGPIDPIELNNHLSAMHREKSLISNTDLYGEVFPLVEAHGVFIGLLLGVLHHSPNSDPHSSPSAFLQKSWCRKTAKAEPTLLIKADVIDQKHVITLYLECWSSVDDRQDPIVFVSRSSFVLL